MGIPKYFRNITKNKTDLIIENIDLEKNIQNLYLDANCIIHPCAKKIESEYQSLVNDHNFDITQDKYNKDLNYITKFEKKVFESIIFYIDRMINYTNPTESLFIAIDGVAPRAKMEQQRIRRYRSSKCNQITKSIFKKHQVEKKVFDSNCITPGTIFMLKLSIYLKNYLHKIYEEKKLCVYLSDANNLGEGEHKILQHIKKYNKDKVNCIYGLDADLIMLALVSESTVYLLRESVHFGKVDMDKLLLFDVLLFSQYLYESITDKINLYINDSEEGSNDDEIIKIRIIKDYICICFFIGNDFLPSLPGLDINIGSIEYLVDIYTNIFSVRRKYLVDENNNINFVFIKQILFYLYDNEQVYLTKFQNKVDRFTCRIDSNNSLDRDLAEFNYLPIFNKNNYLKLGEFGWMDKYYEYYFNISNSIKDHKYIHHICNNYIEGLQWNIKYYLEECVSYSWYYKFRGCPPLKDLCLYLINRVYPATFENIIFNPLEQLSIVLPIQCQSYWCKEFKKKVENDKKLSKFYPSDFELDTLNKVYVHDCDPILPNIDDSLIKKVFSEIKLSEMEQNLNKVGQLFVKQNNISLEIK